MLIYKHSQRILAVAFLLTIIMLHSCQGRYNSTFDNALALCDNAPDSSIALLQQCNKLEMDTEELAKYSLIYTIALDKSGYDVDNDSLIRIAYNYYNSRNNDSLYSKCQYYMGKYYMLTDSTEKAKLCLTSSYNHADQNGDFYTKCLALNALSHIQMFVKPSESILYARQAEQFYKQYRNKTISNEVYYKLNLSESLWAADSIDAAISECRQALRLATSSSNDSLLISNVLQDLSCFYDSKNIPDSALFYAQKSYSLRPTKDASCLQTLSSAYISNDSLGKAKEFLFQLINSNRRIEKLSSFRKLSAIALKEHDYAKATEYTDSAFHNIESMYTEALGMKDDYYIEAMHKEREIIETEKRAEIHNTLSILITAILLILVLFILYVLHSHKRLSQQRLIAETERGRLQLEYERKLNQQEKEKQDRLHAEEIKYKEKQIQVMHDFLMHKIEISRKIEQYKENVGKHILISKKDWEEIEVLLESAEDMFVSRLRQQFPLLSEKDLQLMMLLRLKMPTKALASIYGISEKSIKQKLFVNKSKLGLGTSSLSLREYIESF